MTKYFLLLFTLLMGCGEKTIYEPPFVIVDKSYHDTNVDFVILKPYWIFVYSDKNGNTIGFHELTDKYNIGDTIGAKPDLHRDWMRELSEKQNNTIGK